MVALIDQRERGGPPLRLQLLEAASTDLTTSSHSWRNPKYGHDMERGAHVAMHIALYFRHPLDIVHPYASPLMAPELDGVAPTYIMSGEFDPRRDRCEAYAARLTDAGVKADCEQYVGPCARFQSPDKSVGRCSSMAGRGQHGHPPHELRIAFGHFH